MEVKYHTTVGEKKCGIIMPNQLQCPEKAAFSLELEGKPILHVCKHHFSVGRQVDESQGYKYTATDNGEQLPVAKQTSSAKT